MELGPWQTRIGKLKSEQFEQWLSLLREIEKSEHFDTDYWISIAICQSKLGWYGLLKNTLDKLEDVEDPVIRHQMAKMRCRHWPSEENSKLLRASLKELLKWAKNQEENLD